MYFQIKNIILWPKNQTFDPRIVEFTTGTVNVITGASRTGKSAIIPIIDYCLGAGKCSIPVKTIRDCCEWFGILVQTDEGQKLLTRRNPGLSQFTEDMFVMEGESISIPRTIQKKNTGVDSIKRSLDQLAGLTSLDFDNNTTSSGFKSRPSFRDMAAFNFQPQNLIANRDVLFYKADTYEHREKLKTIFPYILGAITPDILAKQHELERLRRELLKRKRELASIQDISERWISEIRTRVSEAKEIGLIDVSSDFRTLGKDQLVDLLYKAISNVTPKVNVTSENIDEAIKELMELKTEEEKISLDLFKARQRLLEMTKLKETAAGYEHTLHIQRDRLKISEWLSELYTSDHKCPTCNNDMVLQNKQLQHLYLALQNIEQESSRLGEIPAAFDRELERIKAEVKQLSEKLQGIQIRRNSLEQSSEAAKNRHYEALKVSRFIGNVEQALEIYKRIGNDGELADEVQELEEAVKRLGEEVAEGHTKAKRDRALAVVAAKASRLLEHLDVERPFDPIKISLEDLTIKICGVAREDYLWEIGSGSNWLSYHIAVSLGLLSYFNELPHSAVPSFIVFDQPSQVYFPKRLVERDNDESLNLDPQFERDEDVEAVKKAFQVFSDVALQMKGKLQIIVLDHAPEEVWGGVKNIHLVEEWRNNKQKLIPEAWLQNLPS